MIRADITLETSTVFRHTSSATSIMGLLDLPWTLSSWP